MPPLPWLEHYRRELERRGVPLSFQKRFLEELQDHLIDLTEEIVMSENIPHDKLSKTITDRLGAPEHVATATAAEYARGEFAAKLRSLYQLATIVLAVPVLGIAVWAVVEDPGNLNPWRKSRHVLDFNFWFFVLPQLICSMGIIATQVLALISGSVHGRAEQSNAADSR